MHTIIVVTVLVLIILSLLVITPLRRRLITQALFGFFKRRMPPMSQTEAEAIAAGDTWWEQEIFRGKPNWQKLRDLKLSSLSAEEQAFLDNETETLCTMLDDWRITHTDKDLTPEVWQFIKDKGFLGMVIERQYGGKGFSAAAHSAVVMKLATKSITAAVTVMVPNSLGPGELLHHYGTDAQKQYYLPRLARGEEIPCFGLTSEAAGSDATAMVDRGVVCKGLHDGREVLGFRLTLAKRYITLAPVATLVGVAFKLSDPEHLLGAEEELGITLCLLPSNHPGLDIGRRHWPLDIPFMNGPITGKELFVPLDWVIGGREKVGQGWRMLVECLSIGRSISLPALSSANAALSFIMTSSYASLRKQFKIPIVKFEGVEEKLAQIGGLSYVLEACRLLTLTAVDHKIKPSVASAIAKYHMTELGRTIINAAMDIQGGKGIILGPNNIFGRAYQAIPVSITVEGANILTRNLIIFGQGAVRCHPYVLQEMQAVCAHDLVAFDRALFAHLRYIGGSLLRAMWYGLSGARFAVVPRSRLKRYYRDVTRLSTALAVVSEWSMLLLGGALKRKERLSARLGDALSYLYLASAVLKLFAERDEPESDQVCAQWAVQYCLYEAQEALWAVCQQFPHRRVGALLTALALWDRRSLQKPNDRLDHELVKAMLTEQELRALFAGHCHLASGPQATVVAAVKDPTGANIQQVIEVDAFSKAEIKGLAS